MNVFVFAGTTEGRSLAEILSENRVACTVSVATEYGAQLLPQGGHLSVLQGRLTAEEMAKKFTEKKYDYIIDATHPFATEVSAEIKKACILANQEKSYLRLARNTDTAFSESAKIPAEIPNFFYFDTILEAVDWLETQSGAIFVTTGSKELPALAQKITEKSRIFARVLPVVESLEICKKSGIAQKQIIAMQGPFSKKTNEIQFAESGARILLTKESGGAGGFFEKIEAAQNLGMKIAVIKNPEKPNSAGFKEAHTVGQILEIIGVIPSQPLQCPVVGQSRAATRKPLPARFITLAGLGMGNPENLTVEATERIQSADIIFGAERILKSVASLKRAGTPAESLYDAQKISEFLKSHPDYKRPIVIFSGDVGFFSGCAKFLEEKDTLFPDWEFSVCAGVSSPQYFAAKLGKPWQNWKLLSLHGSKCNIIEEIRKNPACFFILSGEKDVRNVGELLEKAEKSGSLTASRPEVGADEHLPPVSASLPFSGMAQGFPNIKSGGKSALTCFLGSNLSYDVEKIAQFVPSELTTFRSQAENPALYVLLVENPAAVSASVLPVLRDDDFIRREKIPMTKKEVRRLSICALGLSKSSIVYDIGCGTGSITVEAARIAGEGRVFAVDCKEEAVSLTSQNVGKFCLENVICLHLEATDFLQDSEIPAPTHAFIGGSGGNLLEIVRLLLQKNPAVRIVANFVSLENLAEMQSVLKSLGIQNAEITQLAVSRAERQGSVRLMRAQNPVWVVSFG